MVILATFLCSSKELLCLLTKYLVCRDDPRLYSFLLFLLLASNMAVPGTQNLLAQNLIVWPTEQEAHTAVALSVSQRPAIDIDRDSEYI